MKIYIVKFHEVIYGAYLTEEKAEKVRNELILGEINPSLPAQTKLVERWKWEDEYEDGDLVTLEALMTRAANKYKTLVLKEKWLAPSPQEEKVLALKAKVKFMYKKKGGNQSIIKKGEANEKKPNQKKTKEKPA